MTEPLIRLEKVRKAFGDNVVLDGADLSIYEGEITAIIGKSGGGKSVLLKHIIGLLKHDSGYIRFQGKALSEMKTAEQRALKRRFSYMFQGSALFDSMTVLENVALPLVEKTSMGKRQIREKVRGLLDQLDLSDINHQYPSQLSGGMKKRVALARALITDPEIVLFDEPTTGLDPIRKNAVHSMISDYQKQYGFTGVIVSHELPDIFYISQRIAMLYEGRIIFEGSPEEIDESTDPVVQQFVHGMESRHDELTGLAPRFQGERRYREEIARLRRYQDVFSVIILSVESHNTANVDLKYWADQSALKSFSTQMRKHLRVTDICSRYGLNKIMIMLPNTTLDQAQEVCDKLAGELRCDRDGLDDPPDVGTCFTVTAGIAEAQAETSLEQVITRAESSRHELYEFRIQ